MMTGRGTQHASVIRDILITLGVSRLELAQLIGVDEVRIARWQRDGVPDDGRQPVEALYRLTQILRQQLAPAAIPAIVRRSEAALHDRSMLEVIAAEGVAPIVFYLLRIFSREESIAL